MDEFAEKVALITGAGRGIGREISRAFAELGTIVAANDINPLNLNETVGQIVQAGGIARAYVFDIAKRMPIEGLVAQVLEHFGRIDILINHASISPDAPLLEMDEWEFHRTLDVNLGGAFFATQQVGRVMQQQGGGTIINLISTTGETRFKSDHPALSASQAGLLGLTLSAANELGSYHIRVNAVCFGPVLPGLAHSTDLDLSTVTAWRESHPRLWFGDHFRLSSTVLYLCSQAASSLTGQIITIDITD